MPELDQITASVFVGRSPVDEALTKVRVTIWSGQDFRAHIVRGAVFEDDVVARYLADKAVEALELLGIPITDGLPDGHERAEPLLHGLREGEEYPRGD